MDSIISQCLLWETFNVCIYDQTGTLITNNRWTKEFIISMGQDGVWVPPEKPGTSQSDVCRQQTENNLFSLIIIGGIFILQRRNSFHYPDKWVILDAKSEFEVVEIIDSKNNADSIASFKFSCILDQNPLGVFTGDEASVREAVNENATFIKFGDAMLGGCSCQEPDISESRTER